MVLRTISPFEGRPLLDLVSYARRGVGRGNGLFPAQVEQIARTVRRVPEVMVKVTGGGTSAKAVLAHFKYIDRHGKLDIESDDGEQIRGKGAEKSITEDWDLEADEADSNSPYDGKPGRKPGKLVHNIILSMPAGTPPTGLLAASLEFARAQFALKHRYAMVLHTDQPHPHVHLVVKATSEHGRRLNIRKATLREWRHEFARHLRERGIAANATERAVRGKDKTIERDGIYRAMHRGQSTYMRKRAEAVAAELVTGHWHIEQGKATLLTTRREVDRGWRAVSDILARQGQLDLVADVRRFAKDMSSPLTDRERLAAQILDQTRRSHIDRVPSSR
jgi:Relaxase/Mobilisation nuclease domain